MKHFYLLIFTVIAMQTSFAQIVNIPDANFKNALLNYSNPIIDTNSDGEIQVSEAEAVTPYLDISSQNISSLEGINSFTNVTSLNASNNLLTSLDISNLDELFEIDLSYNLFTTTNAINFSTNLYDNNWLALFIGNNLLIEIDQSNLPPLESFDCSNNQLTSLDLSSTLILAEFYCTNNPLTSLILMENPHPSFYHIDISNTSLSNIDFSNQSQLTTLRCNNNPNLTALDLSENPNISNLYCENNSSLEIMSFKNGNLDLTIDSSIYYNYNICNNTNLVYVCADEYEIENYEITINEGGDVFTNTIEGIKQLFDDCGYTNLVVNSYCSFEPGGNLNTIQGSNIFDANSNGCDTNDGSIADLKYTINSGSFSSDTNGDYIFYVGNGIYTITPDLENSEYFTVSPESYTVNFQTDTSPFTQDFCITPNGTHNDLEITILPIEAARPGFDTDYKLVYKNKGTTTLSGTIDLMFQDNIMDYVSSNPVFDSQTTNSLNWNYSNLTPFESREIIFTMNLNTPTETPAVNGDDVLSFVATINPISEDETEQDNTFNLNQTVVNSFDPNDKTCLEGNTITPDLIGENVHYLIRFENTGTANAINVAVKDIIDIDKFDISTLYVTDSSHNLVTKISNTNVVEFIFENINLPFDDANNDGYILFKIKTLNTLVEGDTFENDAEIYFDFNFPIITNNAITSIEEPLSTNNFETSIIEIYPNPVKDKLYIKGETDITSLNIYDITGRLIQEISCETQSHIKEISTEKLTQGTYFLKVKTESGKGVRKFVKE